MAQVQTRTTQTTVADLFLESLAQAGVDYLFAVLGSDHPSIIEAYTRREKEGKVWPKLLIFLHEFVAISAADGFARLTNRPQCVIVHVDVGTAALGQGLHNASTGRAPVLIFAGQAPLTLHGELPGSRSEHVQWYQDVPNQSAIVAPYSRFSAEIKCAEHARLLVNRALKMAATGSAGPTHLTASREVLAAPAASSSSAPRPPSTDCAIGGLPPAGVQLIGDALLAARRPLAVTGYLGRNPRAVAQLVVLADLVKGLRVFDSEFRYASFPADHRASVTRATGAAKAVKAADVVLVLDADVPWIPTKVRPEADGVRIFHVDVDARKEKMVLFDVGAEATFLAECEQALAQVCEYVRGHAALPSLSPVFEERWEALGREHADGAEVVQKRARLPSDAGKLTVDYLFYTLREVLPEDAIWVSDVVTNQVPLSEQLRLARPGTNFTKGGSGLGWAGGAAIGIKLAAELYPDGDYTARDEKKEGGGRMICSITGDGAFVFGAPTAVFHAQRAHRTPFLSVVVNNGGWKATRSCINDVHPGGVAAGTSDAALGIDLHAEGKGLDYLGVAKAAGGAGLEVARVEEAGKLRRVVEGLVKCVREGRGAVLEAVV